jgi:hypothetical protein
MHSKDTIVISEEVCWHNIQNVTFPSCVGLAHQQSTDCQRWPNFLKDRETCNKNVTVLEDPLRRENGTPIKNVSCFRYLGLIVVNKYSNWGAIHLAFQRAKFLWGRLGRLLSKGKVATQLLVQLKKQ